jgi:hypothetical protein
LVRRTKPYCAIALDRGCARAVKGMKIEAAEVASGEDLAVTIRVMSGRIVKPVPVDAHSSVILGMNRTMTIEV